MKTVLEIALFVCIIIAFVRVDRVVDFEKSIIGDITNLFMN